jgi:hypothetical protein
MTRDLLIGSLQNDPSMEALIIVGDLAYADGGAERWGKLLESFLKNSPLLNNNFTLFLKNSQKIHLGGPWSLYSRNCLL